MPRDVAGILAGLPVPGDIVGGKYRVESVLGVGGMAVVLAATHVHLGEKVALKLVRPTERVDAESYERFFREARVASRIRSEHVARVFDLGASPDGAPYIAMEFLSGSDLATRLARGAASVEEATSWVMQAAEGVAEAHALGVVHRDLKPANLFLTHRSDGTPCVKVLDFGISKILDADAEASLQTEPPPPATPWQPDPRMRSPASTTATESKDVAPAITHREDARPTSLTRSRARIGSPQYMAPEQMRAARTIDARCDIWAMGTILYELLAKAPAFDEPTFDDLAQAVTEREPIPLSQRRPGVPGALVDIIERCLRKSPADRFGDVAELATALAPFVPSGVETAARIGRILRRPRSPESAPPESLEHAPTVSAEHDTPRMPLRGSPSERQRARARAAVGGSVALVAAVAIAAGALLLRSSHGSSTNVAASSASQPEAAASASAPPDIVAVARRPVVAVVAPRDLAGRPDAAWVGTAAAEMLVTDLSSASGTRVVPPERVARALHDLALDHGDVAAPEALARVKVAVGADYVVTGTYAVLVGAHGASDAKIRLDLALLDTKDGSARARSGSTGAQSELFDLIGRAASDLRSALGEAAATPEQIGEARAASPSSPEATRLYAKGIERMRAGKAVEALPILEQAERLAPDSPLVAWQHGIALRQLGRDNDSVPVLKKAFDLRTPLSREYQLRIEAAYRESMHDWEASAEAFHTLFGFFPDSIDYGVSYARALANSGRPKDAWVPLDALRKRALPEADMVQVELQSSANAGREADLEKREKFARAAVAGADANGLSSLQIEAHMQLGQTLESEGSLDAALPEFERARALAGALGDESMEAGAITAIADVYQGKGDLARAFPLYDDALARTRELGDLYRAAGVLNTRANAKYTQGDLEGARIDWIESAREYTAIGDREGVGHTTGNVALVYEDEGDLAHAHSAHEKAFGILKDIGNRSGMGEELCNLVELELQRGDMAAATKWQDQLDALLPQLKRKLLEGIADQLRAMIARQKDDPKAAAAEAEQARAVLEGMGAQPFTSDAKLFIAELALDRGDGALAETSAAPVAEWYRTNAIPGSEPIAYGLVARALASQGKTADALATADRATVSATKTGRILAKLEAARAKGVALGAAGQVAAGLTALDGAIADAHARAFVWEELELRLARASLRAAGTGGDASLAGDARAKGFARIARLAAR